MPPRKSAAKRGRDDDTPASGKKGNKKPVELPEDDNLDTANPVTISQLMKTYVKIKFRGNHEWDWSVFVERLSARNAESPRWFIALREEDLLTDREEGVKVESFSILEATTPTLAPMHIVQRVHRCYADTEDCAPERFLTLKDCGLCWRAVTKDDGSAINAFVMSELSASGGASAGSLAGASFAFGAAPAAPPTTEAKLPSAATESAPPVAKALSFGFGSQEKKDATAAGDAAAPAPALPTAVSFGFGQQPPSAAPSAAAAPVSFNFGGDAAAKPAATAPAEATKGLFAFGTPAASDADAAPAQRQPTFNFGVTATPPDPSKVTREPTLAAAGNAGGDSLLSRSLTTFGAAAKEGKRTVPPRSAIFVVFSLARLREVLRNLKSGERIVAPFTFSDGRTLKKLQMQNDRNDDPEDVAEEWCLKEFAKTDSEIKAIDEYLQSIPHFVPVIVEAQQKAREKYVRERAEEDESGAMQALRDKYKDQIAAELARLVAEREKEYEKETKVVTEAQALVKAHYLAPLSDFKTYKFYPSNHVVTFRPHGKISGVHEAGQHADECVPPAFQTQNAFALAAGNSTA